MSFSSDLVVVGISYLYGGTYAKVLAKHQKCAVVLAHKYRPGTKSVLFQLEDPAVYNPESSVRNILYVTDDWSMKRVKGLPPCPNPPYSYMK